MATSIFLGGTGAPTDATFLTETANATLSAEVLTTTQIATGTVAALPAATQAARLYLPSDGVYVYRDSGSIQTPWGPVFPLAGVANAPTTWVNQGTASVDTTNGGVFLRGPVSATPSLRVRVKSAPGTPYTITAVFLPAIVNFNFQSAGLVFRQSSDGKMAAFSVSGSTSVMALQSDKWTDATTFSATYVSRAFTPTGPVFLRIADNATNRICSYSTDGQHWVVFHSVLRTDFLTADQVGFFVNDQTNTYEVGMNVLSWLEA